MRDLAYVGEPLIIVTASSILDVGRGQESVSDIFCINYLLRAIGINKVYVYSKTKFKMCF